MIAADEASAVLRLAMQDVHDRVGITQTDCYLLPVIGRRTNSFQSTCQINARRSIVKSGCGSCLIHIGGEQVCSTYTCNAADERVGRLTSDPGCCNVASPQTATV